MKKRIGSLLLAILLMVCTTMVTAFASDTVIVTIDGIRYKLDICNSTAMVLRKHGGYSGDIRIPTIVDYNGDGFAVTAIGGCAFINCKDLTSVQLPSMLRRIGPNAFRGCSNLTTISYLRMDTEIGRNAFKGCDNLVNRELVPPAPTFPTIVGQAMEALFSSLS